MVLSRPLPTAQESAQNASRRKDQEPDDQRGRFRRLCRLRRGEDVPGLARLRQESILEDDVQRAAVEMQVSGNVE